MFKKKKPSLVKYFKLPNPGLRAYFKHTESGNPDDFRPPLFKGRSRRAVLNEWQKIVDQSGLKKDYPSLYQFEMDMKAKVGPMSIQKPLSDRIPSIEEYYTCVEHAGEPISSEAIRAAAKFFSKAGGIRLRSIPHVVENMRLSTNSGGWLFTKRRRVVDETLAYTLDYSSDGRTTFVPQFGDGPRFTACAVAGWRGQEGGPEADDVKQRVVWMMPFLLNIAELQFYQPAIEAIQKAGLIPAYVSMEAVDREVTALFDSKDPDDLVVCTDFTAFDQHFNEHLQNAAKEIEMSISTLDKPTQQWFSHVFPVKFNIELCCSEDLMYEGPHGMGSGSGGTNFDECMAHKALQYEAAQTEGTALNPHSMAYGDDGILSYKGCTAEKVTASYTRHGQVMNITKQYESKHDCVVLRRWHGDEYRVNGIMVGVYSTFRALGRLLAQERFYDPDKWSNEMVIIRSLSILENCKWSPLFHALIDFVLEKGDKYRLGLGIPGFFDRLDRSAKQATEDFQDFLGYTKNLQQDAKESSTGIMQWEVVKYLRKKA